MRIVADDNMPGVEACCALLEGEADIEIVRRPGRTLTAADVATADVLLVRSITRVDAALLAGSSVRFVGTATIGTDHLDLPWLDAQGIAWASAPGCNARAVGEWVLNVLLQLAAEQGVTLAGRTLGIIGLGHVGRWVARLTRLLGIRVVACDPFLTAADLPDDLADLRGVLGPPLCALFSRQRSLLLHEGESLLGLLEAIRFGLLQTRLPAGWVKPALKCVNRSAQKLVLRLLRRRSIGIGCCQRIRPRRGRRHRADRWLSGDPGIG